MTDLPLHGGDLAHATRRYGEPAAGWLDLSTGINPFPYPVPPLSSDAMTRLPDRAALAGLVDAARTAYGVSPDLSVTATPGTEIAIRLLPLVAPAGKVAIVAPTYASHLEVWTGYDVAAVDSTDAIADDAAVVVIANPNNPDGRVVSRAKLTALTRQHPLVVIDEAFADGPPDASFIPLMAGTNAVVLRSFGKFYGLAGLRLGFVVGSADIMRRLEHYLGDWPVSGAAIQIGEAALRDQGWRASTRSRLGAANVALRELLLANGARIVGHTDLFVLIESDNAAALHEGLARRGIWTRAFTYNARWLRIGIPGSGGMERLSVALAELR